MLTETKANKKPIVAWRREGTKRDKKKEAQSPLSKLSGASPSFYNTQSTVL
jgi:hypothetical protein